MIPFKSCPICNCNLELNGSFDFCANDEHPAQNGCGFQQFYQITHLKKRFEKENIDYSNVNMFLFEINEFKIQIDSPEDIMVLGKDLKLILTIPYKEGILDFPKLDNFYKLIKKLIPYS